MVNSIKSLFEIDENKKVLLTLLRVYKGRSKKIQLAVTLEKE